VWVSSPLPVDFLEALLVRLGGSLETRFGVFTKVEFRLTAQCTTSKEVAGKNFYFCLVY
jgi:hypothetical protein